MPFEVFTRDRAATSADPTARFSPDGKVLSLNPAAMEMLDGKNYGIFLFDPETRQLAIEGHDTQVENSYAITGEKNGRRINCFALVRVHKIVVPQSLPVKKVNGRWLVVEVGPEAVPAKPDK